ncbi:MAG: 4Fe-4S binding protein [Anaerolineales bacterium]
MAVEQKSLVIHLDETRCDGCRQCLPACSYGGLLSAPGERKPYIDPWACTGCGTCTTVCPLEALWLQARDGHR